MTQYFVHQKRPLPQPVSLAATRSEAFRASVNTLGKRQPFVHPDVCRWEVLFDHSICPAHEFQPFMAGGGACSWGECCWKGTLIHLAWEKLKFQENQGRWGELNSQCEVNFLFHETHIWVYLSMNVCTYDNCISYQVWINLQIQVFIHTSIDKKGGGYILNLTSSGDARGPYKIRDHTGNDSGWSKPEHKKS